MRPTLKSICKSPIAVVPAQAWIQRIVDSSRKFISWVPACARTTDLCKVSLTLLVLFTAPSAFSADWLTLVIPNTEDQYFYDRSKLVVEGNEVTYWKKVQFKLPQTVKGKPALSGLMRERIDCKAHTLRLMSYLYHDAQGAVIEYMAESEKEGVPIIPETVGDWFEQAICSAVSREQATKTLEDCKQLLPKISAHGL